jgi:hypothetical protein
MKSTPALARAPDKSPFSYGMTTPTRSPLPNRPVHDSKRSGRLARIVLGTVAAALGTLVLMQLPGEYALLVALVLAALLPAFG